MGNGNGPSNPLEGTDAPFYNTQQPAISRRSSSMTAVFIGVTVALILVGGGVGVFMAMPPDEAPANGSVRVPAPAEEPKTEATVVPESPAVPEPASDDKMTDDAADDEEEEPVEAAAATRRPRGTPRATPSGPATKKKDPQKATQPKTIAPTVDSVTF